MPKRTPVRHSPPLTPEHLGPSEDTSAESNGAYNALAGLTRLARRLERRLDTVLDDEAGGGALALDSAAAVRLVEAQRRLLDTLARHQLAASLAKAPAVTVDQSSSGPDVDEALDRYAKDMDPQTASQLISFGERFARLVREHYGPSDPDA